MHLKEQLSRRPPVYCLWDVYKRQGLDYVELGKQTGEMAAKVLKGEAKASELNFETIKDAAFYGNTKVAENLGITRCV